jgi:hypothetical protein
MVMTELEKILENALVAQVTLEESLYSQVERQISQPDIHICPAVRDMLTEIKAILEEHFSSLNVTLERRQQTSVRDETSSHLSPLQSDSSVVEETHSQKRREQISQMLYDDYAALNFVAMGNTMLHTTALAADSKDIAELALKHLTNMARFVVRVGDLLPIIVALDLSARFPEVKASIGELAAKNAREAWRGPNDLMN